MTDQVKEYIESKSSLPGMQTVYFGDRVIFIDRFERPDAIVQRSINTRQPFNHNGQVAKITSLFRFKKIDV